MPLPDAFTAPVAVTLPVPGLSPGDRESPHPTTATTTAATVNNVRMNDSGIIVALLTSALIRCHERQMSRYLLITTDRRINCSTDHSKLASTQSALGPHVDSRR